MNLGLDTKSEASQLATMMLQWEELQLLAEQLRTKIEARVMHLGMTLTVGTVRASYSAGRKSYDYREAALEGDIDIVAATIERFTVLPPPKTDWREVCDHAKIPKADIPYSQSPPSVTVKLLAE